MKYKVNFGYDRLRRPKNRYFETLEEAKAAAEAYFNKHRVVVSIESVKE